MIGSGNNYLHFIGLEIAKEYVDNILLPFIKLYGNKQKKLHITPFYKVFSRENC